MHTHPPPPTHPPLQIGETLEEGERARLVLPAITKLFASQDRGIRRGLLEHVASYGPSLPDKLVEEQVGGGGGREGGAGVTGARAVRPCQPASLPLRDTHPLLAPPLMQRAQIYAHVATGFSDSNPYLRELTLKSMAVLGAKLSQKTLSQSLLKHLAKLQVGVRVWGGGG